MKTHNYVLGPIDTDSISFTKPDMSPFSEEERIELLAEINGLMDELIIWEDDGYYDTIVIVKTKNYILKTGDKVKFKGSSMVDQKKEPAMLGMVKEIGNSLLKGIDYDDLSEIYMKHLKEAVNVKDIHRWCAKKTITKAVLDCETNPDARLQERKLWDVMQGKGLSEGDKIYVFDYLAGEKQKKVKGELIFDSKGKPKMVEDIQLKCAEDWSGNTHDPKLAQRVWATFDIFKTILDMKQFPKYHNKGMLKKLEELKE